MYTRYALSLLGMAAVCGGAADASPQALAREQTSLFQSLNSCRAIADSVERLACFDGKVAALDAAEKAGDVVIADRAQLRETSKGLFGFGALKLPIIGSRAKLETPEQIEAKIIGVHSLAYGKWELKLDNGMLWRETESSPVDPQIGDKVVIKTGALNSFFLRVGNGRGVRGLRVE